MRIAIEGLEFMGDVTDEQAKVVLRWALALGQNVMIDPEDDVKRMLEGLAG